MNEGVTSTFRLVLPGDANHHGTLYAGSLLRFALEAAYATACRKVGDGANLVLRRVLSLECYKPVPVGALVELRGVPLHLTRVYQVIGIIGTRQGDNNGPWMDALMGFVQVGENGQVAEFPEELEMTPPACDEWTRLQRRLDKLLRIRAKLTDE